MHMVIAEDGDCQRRGTHIFLSESHGFQIFSSNEFFVIFDANPSNCLSIMRVTARCGVHLEGSDAPCTCGKVQNPRWPDESLVELFQREIAFPRKVEEGDKRTPAGIC